MEGNSALTDELGAEMLQKMLSSKVKGELLVLFHKNPGLIDSDAGVARRIGRSAEACATDLEDLISIGILRTRTIGKSRFICLDKTKDMETQSLVGSYLAALKV
jgi:hypothetical protein